MDWNVMPWVSTTVNSTDVNKLTTWVSQNIPRDSLPDITTSSFIVDGGHVTRVNATFAEGNKHYAALFKLFWV